MKPLTKIELISWINDIREQTGIPLVIQIVNGYPEIYVQYRGDVKRISHPMSLQDTFHWVRGFEQGLNARKRNR